MKNIYDVRKVKKVFGKSKETQVTALCDIDLVVDEGEFLALVGPSGSGKTTLLNIMSGLESVTKGDVFVEGESLIEMSEAERSDYRRDKMGFIFQAYNLIPVLNVKENIEYIMMLQGVDSKSRTERVSQILEEVGMGGMEKRFPFELSGGQQQRVAIARAVSSRPSIILADEPTANLDSKTGCSLLDLMQKMNEIHGTTFVFSTHDVLIMERAHRLIKLKDGMISEEMKIR